MRKMVSVVLAAVIALTAVLPAGSVAAGDTGGYQVTLQPDTFQTVEGWGIFPASVPVAGKDWWSKAYAVHNALFDDLGINMYRVELRGICGDGDGNLVQSEMEMFRNAIRIAGSHQQNNYMVSIWTPPAGMKDNNSISGQFPDGSKAMLLPASEQKFCDYIVNAMNDLKANGLPRPRALSIQNEPNNAFPYQSCYYTGEQYRRVTKLMRKTLDAAGYTDILLMGAEAPAYSATPMWFGDGNSELVKDPELANAVGILDSHSYNDPMNNTQSAIDSYIAGVRKFPGKKVWQSEFSAIYGASTSTQLDRAIATMRTFATDMAWVGNEAWFWWSGWGDYRYSLEGDISPTDSRQRRQQECLLEGNGTSVNEGEAGTTAVKGTLYHALAALWKHTPAGSKVMRLTTNDPAVVNTSQPESDLLGFRTPDGNNTVLFVNPTDQTKTYRLNGLSGKSADIYTIDASTEHLTSGNLAPVSGLNIAADGSIGSVVIPAHTINVIVTKTEDTAAPHIVLEEKATLPSLNGLYISRTADQTLTFSLDEQASVEINGVPVTQDSNMKATWHLHLDAPGDIRDVTVRATDRVGNVSLITGCYRYDPDYVSLIPDQSSAPVKTNQSIFRISGKVNTPAVITLRDGNGNVAGTAATDPDLTFRWDAPLAEGENIFRMTADDGGTGISAESTVTVLCSRTGPQVTLANSTFTTEEPAFVIAGTLSKMPTFFTLNGQDVMPRLRNADLTFESRVALTPGTQVVTLKTGDAYGNVLTKEVEITFNKTDNSPSASEADSAGNLTARVPRAKGPVTVDGKLDEQEWKINNAVSKAIQGTPKNIMNFGALWDDNYLYVAARVYDSHVRFDDPNGRPYMNDGVEVFINPGNTKANEYGTGDKQLFITRTGSGMYQNGAGYLSGWDTFDGGYTCEFAIPWSSLGISKATDGISVGFDIQNDDREQTNTGVTRESQTVWSGTSSNWQNTSRFGTLTMDESYIVNVGAPQPGDSGDVVQTISVTGSNPSGKYLVVQYIEGTGEDTQVTVMVMKASASIRLSTPATGCVSGVWLTNTLPDITGISGNTLIYPQKP